MGSTTDSEPFSRDPGEGAASVGVLVLHGFTGSPRSVRPWAESLAAAGLAVRLPRLPGHGTSVRDANRTGWDDWYGEADRAFGELEQTCRSVFVAGLSMGGSLALRLAEQHPARVSGLILVNPAVHSENRLLPLLPALRFVLPSVPGIGNDVAKPGQDEGCYGRVPLRAFHSLVGGWSLVRRDIRRVTAPLLLFRSRTDHVVEPSNERWILDNVRSSDVREDVLERSFHVATLDFDAPEIFAGTLNFIGRITGSAASTPAALPGVADHAELRDQEA